MGQRLQYSPTFKKAGKLLPSERQGGELAISNRVAGVSIVIFEIPILPQHPHSINFNLAVLPKSFVIYKHTLFTGDKTIRFSKP